MCLMFSSTAVFKDGNSPRESPTRSRSANFIPQSDQRDFLAAERRSMGRKAKNMAQWSDWAGRFIP